MNGYLLDTSVALKAMSAPEQVSRRARTAIEKGPVFLSVAVYWEVTIKSMKGLLDVGDPRQWYTEAIESLELRPLNLRPAHVAALNTLPPLHKDPFDRMLVCQAKAHGLTLASSDALVRQYPVALL